MADTALRATYCETCCKVLCHNICVLVQATHELKIEPIFVTEIRPVPKMG